MLREPITDLSKCVEPDRVRRQVYTDAQIFELERAVAQHCFETGELHRLGALSDWKAILGVTVEVAS